MRGINSGDREPMERRDHEAEPSRRNKLSKLDSHNGFAVWRDEDEQKEAKEALKKMEDAFSTIIIGLLGDCESGREELKKTPSRAAKALFYFTKGYEESLQS